MHRLAAGHSLADTSFDAWGDGSALMDYVHGQSAVFGWSGSEHLRFGRTDLLAGFTAWGPIYQGIALTKLDWNSGEFTLGLPTVVSVDEVRSSSRAVQLHVSGASPGARRVEFRIETPVEIEARLEVYDVAGRRRARLFEGALSPGTSAVPWLLAPGERAIEAGVYYARLTFPGGARTATVMVAR
jgi:hypothetical protein